MSNLVQVLNYPHHLSQFAIYDIFAQAGDIVNLHRWTGTNACQITFADAAAARHAVATMNGVACAGVPLQLALGEYGAGSRPSLAPVSRNNQPYGLPRRDAPPHMAAKHFPPSDASTKSSRVTARTRPVTSANGPHAVRYSNAYVLNLSLDMTNEELGKICGTYGQVKHICILATLDNAGRRRAFVDMAKPEDAASMIRGMNGTRIHGYEIHCSYAFVQRSGGPVPAVESDPKTRGLFGAGTMTRRSSSQSDESSGSPRSSASTSSSGNQDLSAPIGVELIVSNLAPAAYIDSDDLTKLFESRGFCVVSARLDLDDLTGMGIGSGVVQFGSVDEAERALATMDGKLVDGQCIRCERTDPKPATGRANDRFLDDLLDVAAI